MEKKKADFKAGKALVSLFFMFQCSLYDLLIILSCFTESVSVADISRVTEL